MNKAHIIAEIQRTAAANGGVPLGQARFEAETGIRKADWSGRFWVRWSDALKEVGIQPNEFNSALPLEHLLSKLADVVRELGHFPVMGELRLKTRSDPEFPAHSTFRNRLGGKQAMIAKLQAFCIAHEMLDVAALCTVVDGSADAEAEVSERGDVQAAELGFVYLMKAGRFYKIGRTNAVGRRERELAIQLPEKAGVVHSIRTDDPPGIEEYWHKRFQDRRKNGEWFELTRDDVAAFRRRKFM